MAEHVMPLELCVHRRGFGDVPDSFNIAWIDVTGLDTVDHVKMLLVEPSGIPPDQQCLICKSTNQRLEDDHTLLDYGLVEGSHWVWLLKKEPFLLSVVANERDVPDSDPMLVCVFTYNSINEIKAKIQDKTGIPPDQQSLKHMNRELDGAEIVGLLSDLHYWMALEVLPRSSGLSR